MSEFEIKQRRNFKIYWGKYFSRSEVEPYLRTLENQIRGAADRLQAMEDDAVDLKEVLSLRDADLEKARDQIRQLREQEDTLVGRAGEIARMREAAMQEVQDAEARKKQLKEELEDLEKRTEQANNETAKAEKYQIEAQAKAEAARQRMESAESAAHASEERLNRAKLGLESMDLPSPDQMIQDDLERQIAKNSKLNERIAELEKKIVEIRQERPDTPTARHENTVLRERVEELEKMLDEGAQGEIGKLRDRIADLEVLERKYNAVLEENGLLKERINRIEKKKGFLPDDEGAAKEIVRLRNREAELEAELRDVAAAREENVLLKEQLAALSGAKGVEDVQAENLKLVQRVAELEAGTALEGGVEENRRLRKQVAVLEAQASESERLRRENEELKNTIHSISRRDSENQDEQEVYRLRSRVAELEMGGDKALLEEQVQLLRHRVEELEDADSGKLKLENEKLQSECGQLRQDVRDMNLLVEENRQLRDRLEGAAQNGEGGEPGEAGMLRGRIAALEAQLQQRDNSGEPSAEEQKLRERVAELEAQLQQKGNSGGPSEGEQKLRERIAQLEAGDGEENQRLRDRIRELELKAKSSHSTEIMKLQHRIAELELQAAAPALGGREQAAGAGKGEKSERLLAENRELRARIAQMEASAAGGADGPLAQENQQLRDELERLHRAQLQPPAADAEKERLIAQVEQLSAENVHLREGIPAAGGAEAADRQEMDRLKAAMEEMKAENERLRSSALTGGEQAGQQADAAAQNNRDLEEQLRLVQQAYDQTLAQNKVLFGRIEQQARDLKEYESLMSQKGSVVEAGQKAQAIIRDAIEQSGKIMDEAEHVRSRAIAATKAAYFNALLFRQQLAEQFTSIERDLDSSLGILRSMDMAEITPPRRVGSMAEALNMEEKGGAEK